MTLKPAQRPWLWRLHTPSIGVRMYCQSALHVCVCEPSTTVPRDPTKLQPDDEKKLGAQLRV